MAEETIYEYSDGRVSRTRTIREPAWLEADFLLAQALDEYERSLCPDCGQPKDVAWDPHNAPRFAAAEIECVSCTAIQERSQQLGSEERRAYKIYPVDAGTVEFPPLPDT